MNIEGEKNGSQNSYLQGLRQLDSDPSIVGERESTLDYGWPILATKELEEKASQIAEAIPEDQISKLGSFLITNSAESHVGPFYFAIDFLCPDGTPVLAAQDGEITDIVESNDQHGATPEYVGFLNYVTIKHKNGEFSQYCHLAKDSVSKIRIKKRFGLKPERLKIGSKIKQGQQIGITGKTGWTDCDHLHFLVFVSDNNPAGFRSLKPKFKF